MAFATVLLLYTPPENLLNSLRATSSLGQLSAFSDNLDDTFHRLLVFAAHFHHLIGKTAGAGAHLCAATAR